MECAAIESAPFPDQTFDLITAWWCFEHVSDPNATLRAIARLLKPNGVFVFGIPNSRSLNATLFRERWYHLDCPRHLFLWTPTSVRDLLERYGFGVSKICHDKTPWGLLGSLQYLVYGDNLAGHANKIRKNAKLSYLLLPPSIAVSAMRMSDTMVITAVKR